MKKYLEKYPDELNNVLTAEYLLGTEETNKILNEALNKNKIVLFENSETNLDLLTYSFI